jgi:hypothetical protein
MGCSDCGEIRHEPNWIMTIRAQAGWERLHDFWLVRRRCRTTPSSAEYQMGRGFRTRNPDRPRHSDRQAGSTRWGTSSSIR